MITIVSFFTKNGTPKLGLTPTLKVREVETGNLIVDGGSGIVMDEIGDGWYKYEFDGDDEKEYVVTCDGTEELSTAERYTFAGTELNSNLIGVEDNITRILGLSQSNYRILNPTYDNKNNLLGGTIKIYPTATDVDNDTNAIESYQIQAEYNNKSRMTGYKVTKI